MRLILRTMLGIVPVFLALSVVIGALVLYLEWRETRWAVEEEGRSTAIAIASFIEPEQLRRFASDDLPQERRAELAAPLERILSSKRVDRLLAFDIEDRRVLMDLGRRAESKALATEIPKDFYQPLVDGSQVETRLVGLEDGSDALLSAAAIQDRQGAVSAVLVTQHDAGVIARRFDRGLDDAITGVSIALVLGLLCSLIIAGVIRSRINTIRRAVDRAAEGEYETDDELERGMIAEFNTLGNTLETMIAALRAAVGKVRRGVLEVDQFRTEEDLAIALEESYLRPVRFSDDRLTVLINSIGPLGQGVFFDLVEQEQRLVCVFGSVDREGVIEPALKASAILRYFRERLKRTEPFELAGELARLFPLARLRMLCLDRRSWQMKARSVDCSGDATQTTEYESELGSDAQVHHDLSTDLGRRLELFLGAFSSSKSQDLMDNLRRVVSAQSESETGVMVVVRRQVAA